MSLDKVFKATAVILILLNIKYILQILEPLYGWLCTSLSHIRRLDDNLQLVMAILTLLAIVVVILRIFNK